MLKKKVKTIHALSWFHGNICTKKCYHDIDKQKRCYDKMREIIKGNEDFLITHKMFIWVMREKHNVCNLGEAEFRRREIDFWTRKL